jgi:hypothetical protein
MSEEGSSGWKFLSIILVIILVSVSFLCLYSFSFPVVASQDYVEVNISGPEKLGVNEPGDYAATVNVSDVLSFNWSILPSTDKVTLKPDGDKCQIVFNAATDEVFYLCVDVRGVDSNVKGYSVKRVVDPYTNPSLYLASNGATYDYLIRSDGLGWYQSVNGSTNQIIESSTSSQTVISNVFGNATGKVVVFAGGFYYGNELTMPTNMTLIGFNNAELVYNGVSVTGSLLKASSSQQNFFMTIQGMKLNGAKSNCTLLNWVNVKNSWIRSNEFFDTGGCMVKLVSVGGYESFYNHIESNQFEISAGIYQPHDYSVAAVWSQGDNFIKDNVFDNWPNQFNMFIGILTVNSGDKIVGNHITHCWNGIRASSLDIISSNYFDTFIMNGVSVSGKEGVVIVGNTFLASPSEPYHYAVNLEGTGGYHVVASNVFESMEAIDFFVVVGVNNSNCTVSYNSFMLNNAYGSVNNLGANNTVVPALALGP